MNDSKRVNETITPTAYRDCTCSSQTIRVSAVNRCEREDPSSFVSLNQGPTLLDLPNFDFQCDAPTSVQSTHPSYSKASDSNNGNSKMWKITSILNEAVSV